jgi:hypothetical protein
MTSIKNAIDCKETEYVLTAVAPCQVSGVDFAPGATIRTRNQGSRDYLVDTGAAVEEKVENVDVPETRQVSEVAATSPTARGRIGRSR